MVYYDVVLAPAILLRDNMSLEPFFVFADILAI